MPVWLFAYLGEATPSELAITNLSVIRSNDVWRVRLAGAFQGTNEFTPAAMSRSVGMLSARLTGPPFYLKSQGGLVNQSETAAPAKSSATDSSIPDWVRTVTGGQTGKVASASQPIQDGFLIEGVIK